MKTIPKRILLLIVVILVWQYASTKFNALFVPSPKSVWDSGVIMFKNGQLLNGLLFSFRRISVATCIASSVAIPLGLLIHNFKLAKDTLYPIISLMRYLPITAFYPLLIMWFGIDEEMKIAFLFLVVFVYMLPSVILSLEEINHDLIETGATIGMNKLQIIYMIQLPASLPSILNSFIMSMGIGWTYLAIVEMINAKYGLGYIIQQGSARGKTDLVFVGIIGIMIFSVVFDNSAKLIIKRFLDGNILNKNWNRL
jgi:NitT/TauT family transport system permease protein